MAHLLILVIGIVWDTVTVSVTICDCGVTIVTMELWMDGGVETIVSNH